MKARLLVIMAVFSLAACVPRGGSKPGIGSSGAIAETSAPNPQLVPEQSLIAMTPSWSPAVVNINAKLVEAQAYVVLPGDSLYRIEAKTGVGFGQIVAANALTFPYMLRAGQTLQIPGGLYHSVGRGETGIAIARAYATSWNDIVELNRLQHPYVLREGLRLRLPEDAVARPGKLTPEQRAASFSLNINDIVTGSEPALPIHRSVVSVRPASFPGTFAWPLNGVVLSRFGSQGGGKVNDGVNIAGANDTAVLSAADGVVVYSGNEIGVFGGLVLVDHGSGWITAYGHLRRLDVKRGDKVTVGQSLGGVGETGYVTQPQLHFEIRKDRKPINPLTVLPVQYATR